MITIDDIRTEGDELSPSIIRSRLQRTAEGIDLAEQRIKQLNPRKYDSLTEYDNEIARLNATIAEFREQREFYHGLLRQSGQYEE
jgi:hypothetical protein